MPACAPPSIRLPPSSTRPTDTDLHGLAAMIERLLPGDGGLTLPMPGVHVVRASRPNTELVHGVYKPSVCLIAQGAKRVHLGSEVFEYDRNRMLMCSMDLPVAAEVVTANPSRALPGADPGP